MILCDYDSHGFNVSTACRNDGDLNVVLPNVWTENVLMRMIKYYTVLCDEF